MGAVQKGGGTLREHLTSVWQQTGRKPKELEPVLCPDAIYHIWGWFLEMHHSRGSGAMGPASITYPDIWAWSQLAGISPSPFELGCIRALDYLWMMKQQKE